MSGFLAESILVLLVLSLYPLLRAALRAMRVDPNRRVPLLLAGLIAGVFFQILFVGAIAVSGRF